MGGWKPFHSSSFGDSWKDNDILPNTNPNPNNFKIDVVYAYKNCYVSVITYPDCTNFEGKKVLVTSYNPRNVNTLDPHFTDDSGLIARFEPTEKGINMAKKFAETV